MWGWLLGRIDFQCWVLGKEKVENKEKRGTVEPGSTFWRKDKVELGLGFSNIYLRLKRFFFFLILADVENCESFRDFGFIYITSC